MSNVSIIVINYNGKGVIINCLRALGRQSFKDFDIVIVDNCSSDNSLLKIRKFLEKNPLTNPTRIIPSGSNLGFAGGNLEGLRHATGKYIALLNNDTEADGRWLEELVRAMYNDLQVGICASKLIVYGK